MRVRSQSLQSSIWLLPPVFAVNVCLCAVKIVHLNDGRVLRQAAGRFRRLADGQVLNVAAPEDDVLKHLIPGRDGPFGGPILGSKRANCLEKSEWSFWDPKLKFWGWIYNTNDIIKIGGKKALRLSSVTCLWPTLILVDFLLKLLRRTQILLLIYRECWSKSFWIYRTQASANIT